MGVMYKIVEGKPPKLLEKYSAEVQALYERYVYQYLCVKTFITGYFRT